MALTNNQVKLKFSTNTSTTNSTSGNGDIIFIADSNDPRTSGSAVRKIFARGYEWVGTDTHYANTLTIKAESTQVAQFNQSSDKTVTFKAGTGISVTGNASAGTVTIAHQSGAGYNHIPSGGSAGKYLMYSASGTAKWSDTSYGSASTPIYINAGVPTAISYTIEKSVPSGAVFTDTTYALYAGGSGATANATATNPYINLRSSSSTNSQVQFKTGTGLTVTSASGVITFSPASGYTIPTSTQVTNWNAAYDWYKNTVATTSDADTTINKWQEVVNFLGGYSDDSSLVDILATKADKDHVHDVVSSSANGFAPKIGTAAAATIASQTTEWVLTSTKGATPTWRALPANAFANDTYSATYTRQVNGTAYGTNYSPSQSASINFKTGTAATSVSVSGATSGTQTQVTINGPQLIAADGTKATTAAYNSNVQKDTLFWYDL